MSLEVVLGAAVGGAFGLIIILWSRLNETDDMVRTINKTLIKTLGVIEDMNR